tara:strand:+ start:1360 stop:2214 length:855 start_codon:yes stop_codon:yes gene_type:complete
MAVRNIAITDTLETFRQQFNALAADDFGDIGTLDASLTATSVIGAVNELSAQVGAAEGWKMEDSSSTIQQVGAGQTARFFGASNQITAIVSSPDTLTIGLANNVTIPNNLVVTGEITSVGGDVGLTGTLTAGSINITGATSTIGTIEIAGNIIRSTDSSQIKINDELEADAMNIKGSIRIFQDGNNIGNIKSTRADKFLILDAVPVVNEDRIIFEGDTADANELSLVMTEPTQDRTITFPDSTGTVALTNATGYADGGIFATSVTLRILNSAGVAQKTIVGSTS